MAYPQVSESTLRWYNSLPEYLRSADEFEVSGGGYPLLRFLSLLGDQLDEVLTLADRINYIAPDDGGDEDSTSDLVNANTADAAWLPWLAQLYGVDLSPAVTIRQQREAIASAATGWQAGTKESLANAARSALTGQKFVEIVDHLAGNPWAIGIRTRTSETPDPQALLRAASYAKPAGFILQLLAYSTSWDMLEGELKQWDDWEELNWDQLENLGLGSQIDLVFAAIKKRFIRADGGVKTLNANDEILSRGQGYAIRMAVQRGDAATALSVDNFSKGVLERKNASNATLTTAGTAGDGLHLQGGKANNNNGGTVTTTDWNWQVDADIDRAVGKIQGYRRFYEVADNPAFQDWMTEALQIAQEILTYSTVKVGEKRYLLPDSLQKNKTTVEHNSSFADFAAFQLFADIDLANRAEWLALLQGELDILFAQLQPSSPLGSTPGIPADWTTFNLNSLLLGVVPGGTKNTTYGYEAFKILQRLYWWWTWYSDPRAIQLFKTILNHFRADYATNQNFADVYNHDGTRKTPITPKTYMAEAIYLAAKAVGDTNFANEIKAEQLSSLYNLDANGDAYWADAPGQTTGSTFFSMFWNNFSEMADHGLMVNL